MGTFDNLYEYMVSYMKKRGGADYIQYHHDFLGSKAKTHCDDCVMFDMCIFENDGNEPLVGEDNHPYCHCRYEDIITKLVGSISQMGELAPDVYLKKFGRLPDYYITKEEAIKIYGWKQGKNTIAGVAPGKMLGGDIFNNKSNILQRKENRIWYECDVDYFFGSRNSKRLYYSNDGLMFYSDQHNERLVVQVN